MFSGCAKNFTIYYPDTAKGWTDSWNGYPTKAYSLKINPTNKVGDTIDYVLYTDIVTYINGHPIQSYNINGSTVVVAEDLENFGFSVVWNSKNRSLSVSLDPQGKISSDYKPSGVATNKIGTRAMPVLYTDIVTYLNGDKVTSYNINGHTVINVDDLANKFSVAGGYIWSSAQRTLNVYTSYNFMP